MQREEGVGGTFFLPYCIEGGGGEVGKCFALLQPSAKAEHASPFVDPCSNHLLLENL